MKNVASLLPGALTLLLCLPVAAAPSRPVPHPVPSGPHGHPPGAQSLAHQSSGLCLSASDRGRGRGQELRLEPCDAGSDQMWTVNARKEIVNAATGECLEPGDGRQRGSVGLGDCGQRDQAWDLAQRRGQMTLRNERSNQCLDVTGRRGAVPVLERCDRDDEQFWSWIPAPRAQPAPQSFALSSVASAGTCLDASGPGAGVAMMRCAPRAEQGWVLNGKGELVNVALGLCLEGDGIATHAGRALQLGECRGKNDQTWEEVRRGQALLLRNKAHGHCLDLGGGKPRLATCNGRPDQSWTRAGFEPPRPPPPPPPPPPVMPALMVNQAKGMCLDPAGHDGRQGANVQLDTCDARPDQRWSFDGQGRLVNAAKGLCLDPAGNKGARGSNVALAACTGQPDQIWDSVTNGDTFTLRNRASGLCLDVSGRAGKRGDNVLVHTCDNAVDQAWALTHPAPPQPPPVVHQPPPVPDRPRHRPPPAPAAMAEELYAKVLDGMRRSSFSKDKIHAFEVGVDGYHLTCAQLVRALKLVTFSNDQIKLVEYAAPRILDRENREDVVRVVTFSNDQRKVRELLR